jgi:hypothetical protein
LVDLDLLRVGRGLDNVPAVAQEIRDHPEETLLEMLERKSAPT